MDKKRILVVDDSKQIVDLIRLKLENEGLECLVASSGSPGIRK